MTRGEISERQESNAESTAFSIADLSIYFHLLPTAHILPRAGEEDKTNVRETEVPGRAGGGEGDIAVFWHWLKEKHPVFYEVFWDVILLIAIAALIRSF